MIADAEARHVATDVDARTRAVPDARSLEADRDPTIVQVQVATAPGSFLTSLLVFV